jgi:hypothetical protein
MLKEGEGHHFQVQATTMTLLDKDPLASTIV